MDGNRFDQLTRMVGKGASRRSILKGLLGLGGAAVTGSVVASEADARTIGTRPTIPPPTTKPPTTTSTTPAPCPGQQQCPNSTLCCPTGTCARSGNQAICCTGHVCGHECCDSPYECCDGECCVEGHICLTTVFAEGPGVEEEVCCLAQLTCDNQCCDGDCYFPAFGPVWDDTFEQFAFNGHPIVIAQATCCPNGGSVCPVGFGEYSCCGGDTPKCCPLDDISRTPGACLLESACCDNTDCPVAGEICCDHQCVPAECCDDEDCEGCGYCDEGSCFPCGGEGGGVCCDDVCRVDDVCCDDAHCDELYIYDAGCMRCDQTECVILGLDETVVAPCVINETPGICCYGFCIPENEICEDCLGVGENCLVGIRECCAGSMCDLASSEPTCIEIVTTTTTSTTTTTTTSTTTTTPCPEQRVCGSRCCPASEPFCLSTVNEFCGECLSTTDCGGNVCCGSICCDAGEACISNGDLVGCAPCHLPGDTCTVDGDCCNSDCNSHGVCGCVAETQTCVAGDICCESRFPGGPQPCPASTFGSACILN